MTSFQHLEVRGEENSLSRMQSVVRNKTSNGNNGTKKRHAFGELSNTVQSRSAAKKGTKFSSSASSGAKKSESLQQSMAPVQNKKLSLIDENHCLNERISVSDLPDIEYMPISNDNHTGEDVAYEECVWPKEERLSKSDLDFLLTWTPSQKPKLCDTSPINSSGEYPEMLFNLPTTTEDMERAQLWFEPEIDDGVVVEPPQLLMSDDEGNE